MRPQAADSARWRRWIISAHCGDGDKWQVLFEARSGERMADKMTTWKTTYISAVVHQAGDNPIINEQSTTVTICDEAAGAFISLTDSEGTTIKLDQDEFEIVANVAKGMIESFGDKPRTSIYVINEAFNKAEELLVRNLRSDGTQSKSGGWTSTKPTKGGIYWVQFDHSIAPQSVEVYRLDEGDVWRARVVGNADILGNHIASFQVESLANALWCGPLSAPTLTENEAEKT